MTRTQAQDVTRRRKRELIDKWRELQTRDDWDPDALQEAEDERDELADVLIQVKYWLLDGLVHERPVTSPRRLLRLIEEHV